MEINVFNNYGEINFDFEKIIEDIRKEFDEDLLASIILVTTEEIQKINKDFRHLDYPTDVISFESDEEDYLGDIFICVDKVFEQAQAYNHSISREFAFLLVHGLLHLQGYDHLSGVEEQEMFARQEEILNRTNYRRE